MVCQSICILLEKSFVKIVNKLLRKWTLSLTQPHKTGSMG